MKYKTKTTKHKPIHHRIPKDYWFAHEVQELKEKYPKRIPPLLKVSRTATRNVLGIPQRVHKKGAVVQYKGSVARVLKVEKRGIWLEPFKKPTENSIAYPSGKKVFVTEKEIEAGKVYSFGTNIPFYFSPPFELGN